MNNKVAVDNDKNTFPIKAKYKNTCLIKKKTPLSKTIKYVSITVDKKIRCSARSSTIITCRRVFFLPDKRS